MELQRERLIADFPVWDDFSVGSFAIAWLLGMTVTGYGAFCVMVIAFRVFGALFRRMYSTFFPLRSSGAEPPVDTLTGADNAGIGEPDGGSLGPLKDIVSPVADDGNQMHTIES